MGKVRVLLVDDASVVRRLVPVALHQDPDVEVVGTAADGQIALTRLEELSPDIVLLDLEMPVLDGLQTLEALRRTHPRLPVIMFSRFTQRGVEATVRALTLGADDYVPKPGDGVAVEACVREQLLPKIKLLAGRNRAAAALAAPTPPSPTPSNFVASRVEVVVIAASTGGPNALAELLQAFPAAWTVPIVIVQHMPPVFTTRLAERLNERSQLQVREGADGDPIGAAQAWLAPGDFHLLLRRRAGGVRLSLDQGPPVNCCRPAADVLFQSAAEAFGAGVLAVVLTGLGQDGRNGCQRVREAGGQVVVQDRESSVVWSMPGAVVEAGLAHRVLPLGQLGPEIIRRAQSGHAGAARG
jgi:two-component system chemotaxis response regulator CheB